MFGNVDEWTADCYNSNYKNAPTNDPRELVINQLNYYFQS